MIYVKLILMLNYINLISPTPPAPLILFSVFKSFFCAKNILLYQCETVRKHQGRGRIFFLTLFSLSLRIYEAIFCLWRHCVNRFYSLLKAITRLELTSILANSSYVHILFLWVNRKRKMINIVWGHIINT